MKVYKITPNQKNQLIGVEYVEDCSYNPIQDDANNWIISTKEVNETTNEQFLWLKDLPQIDYNSKIVNY